MNSIELCRASNSELWLHRGHSLKCISRLFNENWSLKVFSHWKLNLSRYVVQWKYNFAWKCRLSAEGRSLRHTGNPSKIVSFHEIELFLAYTLMSEHFKKISPYGVHLLLFYRLKRELRVRLYSVCTYVPRQDPYLIRIFENCKIKSQERKGNFCRKKNEKWKMYSYFFINGWFLLASNLANLLILP